MEVLRSEDWSSISYCCGWGGGGASRGPNPLLQAQLGGLRMVPVPWLTSSKPAQMSRSPPSHTHWHTHTHTHTHSNTPSPRALSWPLNQNKALRWHFLSQELSPALWIGISGISSSPQYIFLSLPRSLRLASGSWEGLAPGVGRPLTPSVVRFLNDLSVETSLSLSIRRCPLVPVCFQIGNQGQEAPAKTLSVRLWITHLNKNRK